MIKATMQDIADELNLSRNTVSRAMRGKSGVSEQTKREIEKVAKKLGYNYKRNTNDFNVDYKANFAIIASSFALSQTSFFGIIIEELKDLINDDGLQLDIIEISRNDTKSQNELIDNLSTDKYKYNGVFILSHITDEFIDRVIKLNYPTVLIDHHSPSLKTDSVVTQNEFGTYELVDFLINNKHTKIGFIGNIKFSPSYRERYVGFQQALLDYDIKQNEKYILSDVEEEQKALFNRLSQLENLPDSWFCVNSGLAFIVNTYYHSKGYSVPEDVSIVCFDDTEFSRQSSPPITCVGTDLKLMAKASYETMQSRINSPNDSYKEVRLLPDFYNRQSVNKI